MKTLIALTIALAASTAIGISLSYIDTVFAAFKVEKLNNFFLNNATTGEPQLSIVGIITNNGTNIEDYVDISATLYDASGNIIGTYYSYDDDVKPNDRIPFQLRIPASEVAGGDLSQVANYTIIAE